MGDPKEEEREGGGNRWVRESVGRRAEGDAAEVVRRRGACDDAAHADVAAGRVG